MAHHSGVISHDVIEAADGTNLAYLSTAGSGTPILLVHGFGSDAKTNWVISGWIRSLQSSGSDRPILAIDLRGHGHSGRPADPAQYRVRTMVADLQTVLTAAFPAGGMIDAVGYSLGARLITELAATLDANLYPNRGPEFALRRMVLGGSDGTPLLQGIDTGALRLALAGGALPNDSETRRVFRIANAIPSNDPAALVALLQGLSADPDLARRAPDPRQPVLLAVGTKDGYLAAAAHWANRLPGARLIEIPARDHLTAVPSGVFRQAATAFLE